MNAAKSGMGIKVSVWRTFVFLLLCGFFQCVAWNFDSRNRKKFRMLKHRKWSTEELKTILEDYRVFVTCEDPYVEHFYEKHPQFEKLSAMWIHMPTWQKKVRRELRRRRADAA